MKNSNFSKACNEISQSLLQIIEPTKQQTKSEIKKICTKYSLERIPKNHEILSTVDGESYEKLQKIVMLDLLLKQSQIIAKKNMLI